MRRFLRQIAKYSHEREGKKRRQNPLIQRMIVTKYVNIFLTLNMELENRFILIAGFAGSTSPQQAIFFPLGGGVGKGVVLYRLLYSSLLFVGLVLCLSLLVWVGGLDWSLCLTQGRHVSQES